LGYNPETDVVSFIQREKVTVEELRMRPDIDPEVVVKSLTEEYELALFPLMSAVLITVLAASGPVVLSRSEFAPGPTSSWRW